MGSVDRHIARNFLRHGARRLQVVPQAAVRQKRKEWPFVEKVAAEEHAARLVEERNGIGRMSWRMQDAQGAASQGDFVAGRDPLVDLQYGCVVALGRAEVLCPGQCEPIFWSTRAQIGKIDKGDLFECDLVADVVVVEMGGHERQRQIRQRRATGRILRRPVPASNSSARSRPTIR